MQLGLFIRWTTGSTAALKPRIINLDIMSLILGAVEVVGGQADRSNTWPRKERQQNISLIFDQFLASQKSGFHYRPSSFNITTINRRTK